MLSVSECIKDLELFWYFFGYNEQLPRNFTCTLQ